MIVATTLAEMRIARAALPGRVGFVATMGALHAGHASLIDRARVTSDRVVVSIFVNPTQFGPTEDLARYPRPIDADLALCRDRGVDVVLVPTPDVVYPPGEPRVSVDVPSLSNGFEGAVRPGHFAGVCQVVAKLFNLIRPDVACFGEKDFQQLAVIRAMVAGLNLPVEIVECPTIRDDDGMAMSSRNRFLSPIERARGLSISRALFAARDAAVGGERDAGVLRSRMLATLNASDACVPTRVDYATIVDPRTLAEVDRLEGPAQAIVAMRVGSTRLIDTSRSVFEECHTMLREFFRVPGLDLPIYSFGLMLVIGCWLAILLAQHLSKRSGLDPETFVNLGILALVGGIVGARASHVFENWHQYFGANGEGLLSAINIRSGGLTYYGGVLLATPLCIAYGMRKGIPIPRGMDIIAPCLLIGLGIGRVGCFLNGCCWGAPSDVPWAVTFPYDSPAYEEHLADGLVTPNPEALLMTDPAHPTRAHWASQEEVSRSPQLKAVASTLRSAPVHPSQLYSTAAALLLAGTLVAFYTTAPVPGRVFALMMMLEGVARYTIETLRVEPAVMHVGGYALSYSMVVGALLVPAGAIAWFAFGWYDRGGRAKDDGTTAAACLGAVA